jgi:L-malate glycosyltransferase
VKMKKVILFYSDCPFFAGCENMLINFFKSTTLLNTFILQFIYRWTPQYEEGFKKRVVNKIDSFPVHIFDHRNLIWRIENKFPEIFRKPLKMFLYLFLIKYLFLVLNTMQLFKIIRKREIDIIHINNGGYPGAYSTISMVFAARLCGIRRIVYVINNIPMGYHSPVRWLDYIFDRILIRCVTVFITGSQYAGTKVIEYLKMPANKVKCIHNGINLRIITESPDEVIKRLYIPNNRLIITVIANLEERKGHFFLLMALVDFKCEYSKDVMPFCIIEGTGPEEANLKKYVHDNNLDGDILFIPHEKQIFNLINASDCIILPSIKNEDFPNIILEAMSLGKAIIASNFSGIPEQIEDNISGLLVNPGDISSLKNSIKEFVDKPGLRHILGMNAQKRFKENFTEDIAIDQYCKMYSSMVAEKLS